MGVVTTAVTRPRHVRTFVERDRLRQLTDAVGESRVTTVCAPAGYGKTTALGYWSERLSDMGRPVLWLALRAGGGTLAEFRAALHEAIRRARLTPPAAVLSDQAPDQAPAQAPAQAPDHALIATLAADRPQRPVLVIDDAQLLDAEVYALIARILAAGRDALTTLIASRSRSTVPLARLRSLGRLLEVGTEDLRFSPSDAAQFVAMNGSGSVDREAVQGLVEETAGWIGGIVMAGTMHRREWSYTGDGARPVSGLRREFEAYFDEEVMALEPPRVRNFLIDSAVLDEPTPAACAAVTGCENGRRLLEEVEEAGLFVEASGCERAAYRYHPLFREMILRRLYDRDDARAAELHRRASRYFAEAGDVLHALDHAARSGDQEFLADQLERLAETAIYSGFLYRLHDLATTLPPALLQGRPNLLLAMSWRQTRTLAFSTAQTLMNMAEAAIQQARSATTLSELEYTHLLRTVEHRRIMLMAARDEMAELEPRAEKLLAEIGDGYPYLSCTLLAQLMAARRELYHFHDTLRLEAETRRALHRPGSDFASIALKASAAPTLAAQGKVETAEAMLREAFGFACSLRGLGSGLAALPGLPLAELLYDRGQVREARMLSDAHLPAAREWGFVDQLAAGHIVQARLLATDGRVADALRGLNECHLLSIECGLDRLRAMTVAEQVRILIRAGQLQEAEAAFAAGDLLTDQEPLPTLKPTRKTEAVAVAWLRLEIHNHRLIRARKVAKRWSELVRRTGAIRSAVVFELLLAQIGVLSGERSEARRAARAAVALATPAGWTQMFLDEGPSIGTLLADSYEQGPSLDSAPDRFAAHLVDAFKGKPATPSEEVAGLDSRLASRELDILAMVGGGLRNREIGDRLGLTEGTVKWYMQQIYDKLGVRRRPQAVMRARQLGVLA